MKAMIWKEVRENGKWAGLALCGLALAEFYVLANAHGNAGDGLPLITGQFLMVTLFGSALVGAVLGMLQTLPELRRDQWAALLHRPVGREVIYFGKVAAGLGLYLAAVGVPLVMSIWYAATPGHFAAPFAPEMMIPGLSDLVFGAVFYFAAVLVCLEQGKWLGVRGMTVVFAGGMLAMHVLTPVWTVLAPAIAAVILMIAGWGAMSGSGSRGAARMGVRICNWLIVLGGAQALISLLGLGLHYAGQIGAKEPGSAFGWFEMDGQGQIYWDFENADGKGERMEDMNGKEVQLGEDAQLSSLRDLYISNTDTPSRWWDADDPRKPDHYIKSVFLEINGPEDWNLMMRENYIVGYDKLSRRLAGYFDAKGYEDPGATPVPFAGPVFTNFDQYDPDPLIGVGSKMYKLSIPERSMSTLLDTGGGKVEGFDNFYYGQGRLSGTVVMTRKEFWIYDAKRALVFNAPFQRDTNEFPHISVGGSATAGRIYIAQETDTPGAREEQVYLYVYDLKGHVLASYQRQAPNGVEVPQTWGDRVASWIAPRAAVEIVYPIFDSPDARYDAAVWLVSVPFVLPAEWLRLAGIGLGLAALAFYLAWRRELPARTAALGVVMSFLFGPAGLVGFCIVPAWPAEVRCPNCGRKRPVEGELCPRCNSGWGAPAGNGAEIMEAPTAAGAQA